MDKFNYLSNTDLQSTEQLYNLYKSDPKNVDESWQKFFEGFEFARTQFNENEINENFDAESKVLNLINAYRERGHLFTLTNPVRSRRMYSPTLDFENFGLLQTDLTKPFNAGKNIGIGKATLTEIIDFLKQTYCKSIGVEFRYIRNTEMHDWLRNKMEADKNTPNYSETEKLRILQKLSEAVLFERFLHLKFVGQKRFSLEGAEALIPAIAEVIEKGVESDVSEFIIGMAHRGRLNVLANILQKPYKNIFTEFQGKEYDDYALMGDVKYHLGFNSTIKNRFNKDISLTLSPNPSHLEAVDPVVEGLSRAKAEMYYNSNFTKVIPILIHGDASIAGQGIVYEVIQMSQLDGYKTGGTIHIVINNQIGFTTNYLDARSSTYCTDVAKTIQSPIFHVNGDDVEALTHVMSLAVEFRQKFSKDVFIDILCYRKHGHNESDEPRFTQPILYKVIEKHPNCLEIYKQKLLSENSISASEIKSLEQEITNVLESNFNESKAIQSLHINSFLEKEWKDYKKADDTAIFNNTKTSIDEKQLRFLAAQITKLPENKLFYKKLVKLQDDRKAMVEKSGMLDWAMGELLAYASLLSENTPVRLSGQDVERGTFSHRHSVLTVEDSEEKYIPLNNISDTQKKFQVFNSLLSEYGVLGFEYGYASAMPNTLTIWEAQFGDFFNGAQIIVDQFIASAEEKWNLMNGLVMLLPHGYEGQGSEHSSARMERFLILCADNNIQVANCTTPANFFHLLRRQIKRDFRKPLVVFTPKSLLRHPDCVSPIAAFTQETFHEVIDEAIEQKDLIDTVILCTGKIFYDLVSERAKRSANNIAIIRIEQVYPLPTEKIDAIISSYKKAKEYLWVQEEPANMGAWGFISRNYKTNNLKVVARPASGTPATGSSSMHKIRYEKLMGKVFGECKCTERKDECRMTCIGEEWA
ncbi:MAG: 2-oxoglutarate dehydrogenase E1 component [Bacteroidota bacterium]